MPIAVSCGCGRSLRVKDEFGGRRVRCPGCGTAISVPKPETGPDVEDEALSVLLTEPDRETSERKAAHPSPPPEDSPRPAPKPAPSRTPPAKVGGSARPVRVPQRDKSEGRRSFIAVHPSIILGIFMMVGAVAWLVVGLAFGVLFIYPFILFILGVGAIIRGFRGG